MRGTLENLKASLPSLNKREAKSLLQDVNTWFEQLEPLEYDCFGCKFCIPPEAMTLLTTKFPALASTTLSSCEFEVSSDSWPPVAGDYSILDASAPVAVSTLSSSKLQGKLAQLRPEGLCIVGKTETENIGIDKIVRNVITNPSIQFLILAGKDTAGHQSGTTLMALWENGVNKNMRIIGSKGRRPVLKNVTSSEVKAFRKQIHIDNMISCENTRTVTKRVRELAGQSIQSKSVTVLNNSISSCGCHSCCDQTTISKPLREKRPLPPRVAAKKHKKSSIKLDRAGYFVIIPSSKKKNIAVEHYSYGNKLLRTVEGKNSRDIYLTIIDNNWIRDLGHAAYLGKELARAEFSLQQGLPYVQDGA
jgi:tetrahydromethanopterin S-methyltransferase subunit A